MTRQFDLPVPRDLVGDNAPSVLPGDDPAILGHATLGPTDPVEVRTFQSFTLIYTVGSLGLDDTGGIRIAWRRIGDSGLMQTQNPAAPNYVSAQSNGEGRLSLDYSRRGGQRPWGEILTITQHGGYLRPGETITIRVGDRRGGSPGLLMQTFAEAGRDFVVMADVQRRAISIRFPIASSMCRSSPAARRLEGRDRHPSAAGRGVLPWHQGRGQMGQSGHSGGLPGRDHGKHAGIGPARAC